MIAFASNLFAVRLMLLTTGLMASLGCGESIRFARIEQITQSGEVVTAVVSRGNYVTGVQTGGGSFRDCKYTIYRFKADEQAQTLEPFAIDDGSLGLAPVDLVEGRRVDFFPNTSDHVLRIVATYASGHVVTDLSVLGHSGNDWRVLLHKNFDDPGYKRSAIASLDGTRLVFSDPCRVLDLRSLETQGPGQAQAMLEEAFSHVDAYPTDFFFTSGLDVLRVWMNSPSSGPAPPASEFPSTFKLNGEVIPRQNVGFYVDQSAHSYECGNNKIPILTNGGTIRFETWQDLDQRMGDGCFGWVPVVPGAICKTLGRHAYSWNVTTHRLAACDDALAQKAGMPVVAWSPTHTERLYLLDLPADCLH